STAAVEMAAGRDIVRVTQPTLDVVAALLNANDCEMYGWAIAKVTRRPGPTVYKVLERLTVLGMVTARWERRHPDGNKPRRRFYRLTSAGPLRAHALLAERRSAATGSPVT